MSRQKEAGNITNNRAGNRFLIVMWGILAISCTLYGIIVRTTGSGTGFFLFWLAMGIVFLGFAVAAQKHLWSRLPKWFQGLFLIGAGLVLASFILFEGLAVSRFQDKGKANLDYIVVLGAQVYENGPSPVLHHRLNAALDYLNANPDTICIVSGGQGYNEPFPEAEGMADYLIRQGIDADRILLETESSTTEENMLFSKALIEEGSSVGIVTNNFHLFRGLQMARNAGITDACGIAAGSNKVFLVNNMVREYLGEVKYWIYRIF